MTWRGYFFCLYLLGLLAPACMPERRERTQTEALQGEMRAKKLKRLTKSQITAACQAEGELLAQQLAEIMPLDSPFVCAKARFTAAINAPTLADYDFICSDSVAQALGGKPLQVWQAYQTAQQQKLPLGPNLQQLSDSLMLYTVPVQRGPALLGMWNIVISKPQVIRQL
ncbi:MAG: hypothetical protein MUC97_00070 [Bernardetiaceae bacterium]|jgi:hypothetical protein|nr:hypothetical protein [Bernardetiaceae bacterium]